MFIKIAVFCSSVKFIVRCFMCSYHLAEDEGISLIEAVKRVYSSAMYKQLEIESTKMWHLGPVDLYRELRDRN